MSRKVICGILMLGLLSMGITGRVGMAEAPPSADERPSAQTPSAAEGTPQVDGFRIEEEEGVVRLRVRLSAPVERIEARFLKAAEYQVLIPARLGELPAPAVTVARGAVADALFQPGKEGRSTQILLRLNQPAPCRAYLAAEGREVIVEAQAPRVPPLPPRPPASLGVVTRGPDRLTLDFVDTPLTDILAALAVASGRNVVVTKAVQGRATVHLTEVSFSTALELITKSNGLTYREVEGCYVVGTPEELEKETTAPEVRLVSLPEERLAEAEELLSKVWPDLTLATQPPTTLVLVGPRDLVRQAQSLLTKLPLPSPPVPPVVDTLRLQHAEAETVARVLTQALPQAKVEAQPAQRTVVVVGTAAQVRRARQLLPALDVPPVPAPEPPRAAAVVTLRYLSAETVQKVLPAALPQVTVEAEKQAVVVVGPPEALQQAQSLIAALDVAPAPPPTPPTETPVAAAPAAPSPPARTLAVLRLQQADPEAVRRVLSQLLPKATFEVDTAAKTVLMVGPEADIARARAWLKELDLAPPPAPEPKRTEVVRVQHVEATRVQQWLAQALPEVRVVADPEMPVLLLTGPEEQLATARQLVEQVDVAPPAPPPPPPVVRVYRPRRLDFPQVQQSIAAVAPQVTVQPQPGGLLVLSGPAEEVERAGELLAELDVPTETRLYKVKYVSAQNLKELLSGHFPNLKIETIAKSPPQATGGGMRTGGTAARPRPSGEKGVSQMLVLTGPAEDLDAALALLEQVDTPAPQVQIEAAVLDVSPETLEQIGINWGATTPLSTLTITETPGKGIRFGTFQRAGLNITEAINLLRSDTRSRLLARPSTVTVDGTEARLLSGQRIPFQVQTIVSGTVVTSVEFEQIGVNLSITPHITLDGYVTVRVRPEVSSFQGFSPAGYPQVSTREAEATVRIPDGGGLVIGGLVKEEDLENLTKVPFLGDIPILGELFRYRSRTRRTTELVIFITCKVLGEEDHGP